jgi:murein DD-endopeptidase MepM/ murein hydrolase activator NlpD
VANNSRISKIGYFLVGVAVCILVTVSIWFAIKRLEGEPPGFHWEGPIHAIGASYTLRGLASDQKSGLKKLWIAIIQQGKEVILFDQTFPSKGFLMGGAVRKQSVSIDIKASDLGLRDGEALLRVALWDYSYRGWWSGNRFYEEHKVVIDTKPPVIEMITQNHNLNQGGTGLAIYRVSEPIDTSGVQVDERFFPGSSGLFADSSMFVGFFALPHDKGTKAQLYVTATDRAGNTSRTGFSHYINTKTFRQDTIHISDAFLEKKMPEFDSSIGVGHSPASLLEKFLAVNRDLRQANHKTIENACQHSDAQLHWTGAFLRLPGSARRAGFAERRVYYYQGRAIDHQTHLGIDLASTAHSPVPAANSGRVAFAEELGIYGKTVIIDHGFGLFSLYGHLSRMQVTRDQMVSKGEIIGLTGSTGLAGGDHLHFSILIHETFVNPVEWWDPAWIKHNITDKLARAKGQTKG